MLDFLIDLDTQVLLFFNSFHSTFFDYFMMTFTGKAIWIPMYASIIYILFRRFGWKIALCYTLSIPIVILCVDQLCASLIRPLAERLRPTNLENPISAFVHIVDGYRGGKYGFPSCHAANSFALATFLSFLFAKRRFTIFIFTWALITSYSRMYLGVHYPGDLLVGAIIGSVIGYIIYCIAEQVAKQISTPRNVESQNEYAHFSIKGTTIIYQLPDIMIAIGLTTSLSIIAYSFIAWL